MYIGSMNDEKYSVNYNPVYGRLYILFGIIFSVIFILGIFVLKDYTILLYLLFSGFLIVIGKSALKTNYAVFSKNELILFNLFGKQRKKYSFSLKTDVISRNNHLYYKGKKIKLNNWFVKKNEWRELMEFYATEDKSIIDEIQE
jgi:hypothetical protein